MATLPKTVDEIKKDAKLMGAYLKYAQSRATLNEVMFYFDKGNAMGLYPKYIDPKAKLAVNVDSKVTAPAKKLADAQQWDHADWPKILQAAKDQVVSTLNPDIPTFGRSKEYADYCKTEKMGSPAKAAKLLGIGDVKKLTQAMEALALGDSKTGVKLLNEILAKEKMKAKAEELVADLKKSGLLND